MQVFHLGTPLTTASESVDYFVSDRVGLPPSIKEGFVEKIAMMPHTYSVNSHRDAPPLGTPPPLPPALRLANLDRKLDPVIWSTWLNALHRVRPTQPMAVLWLLQGQGKARQYLKAEAASRGTASRQLEIVERANHEDHIRRVGAADLYLDTPRCNSVATAADLLWAAVPLVATPLETLPSRGSLSLLHALGHQVGMAATHKGYEDLVVATVS